MSTPVRASDRDLRALAAIVSQDRPDLPDAEGLPPSLLAEMKGQIRCDGICFMGFDSGRHKTWVLQAMPALEKDDLETRNGSGSGALGALLGQPALQLPRPHR